MTRKCLENTTTLTKTSRRPRRQCCYKSSSTGHPNPDAKQNSCEPDRHTQFSETNHLKAVLQEKCQSIQAQTKWPEGGERRIKENDKEKQKEEEDVKTSRHMNVLKNVGRWPKSPAILVISTRN